jgi:xanthine dehydrogenase YagS FAD-binding subunit
VNAAEFFTLPTVDAARENVLTDGEILADVALPRRGGATIHSAYHKVLDREAWTHAVISVAIVMEMEKDVCRRARVVLGGVAPIPWQLPEVEKMVVGQRATRELATKAGEEAVRGARAMAKNAYKVPMVRALVARAIGDIADRGMRIAD